MMHETFTSLLRDGAHWEFELFVGFLEMIVFDVVIGLIFLPVVKKHWKHHIDRDRADETYRRY